MRKAQKELKTDDMSDCLIYSNFEPCSMCAFMIRELGFSVVVFSLKSPYCGGYSRWDILQDSVLKRLNFQDPPTVITGVLEKKARGVMLKFEGFEYV